MNFYELCRKLDERFPSTLSCPWDNDGIMVCPDGEREIEKLLFALDITPGAIEKAEKEGYDTIISHHPLIFKPLGSIDKEVGIAASKTIDLIKSGLRAASYHTRLDSALVNDALRDALSLSPGGTFFSDGQEMGRIGLLEREMTCREFALFAKEKLGAGRVSYSDTGKKLKKIALLGGSGGSAIYDAVKSRADAFLTGECSYNRMLDAAEEGFPIFVLGHFYTEHPALAGLEKVVKEIAPGIETGIYRSDLINDE